MISETTKLRCDQLFNLGLKFNFAYDSYVKDDINVHSTEIECIDDKEWNRLINKITFAIEQRKLFDSIKGLNVFEADLELRKINKDYFIHIDQKDGKDYMRTCDVNFNRFGVVVEKGVITEVYNG